MPSHFCVPNCRANYPNGPKVAVFSFPQDEDMKRKWLRAIPRQDFVATKASKVNNARIIRFL